MRQRSAGCLPLNGFVSEWLIYARACKGLRKRICRSQARTARRVILGIGALALIGGLAAACFTKAFGVVFLGEPRGPHAEHAHKAAPAMWLPMVSPCRYLPCDRTVRLPRCRTCSGPPSTC